MTTVAIVGNGSLDLLPELSLYMDEIDVWIGADRGALTLIENHITPDYALGDFDSISQEEKAIVKQHAYLFEEHPVEKNSTDLELALRIAYEWKPVSIYLFGVTGGRLDHEIINIQTLYSIAKRGMQGFIVDKDNWLTMVEPGTHTVTNDINYPNLSFVPFTQQVRGLSLEGFYYPLVNQNLSWGSTRCISNKLLLKNGTFSFNEGILLLIKSRDAINETIPIKK
ncbi:thiamine diphosphokinase [Virgibacillus dakarensis]|uniref:Thiamine diphosphokinase n=1 Tax=Lentibacillus populi TaxID=1827502 RepID=A0A9W5X4A4_9BACI|nr:MULTISPECIES: thiamine diphosphokinase [Bacillaceae]MBT2216886.1 thiamine diphosphokinase [Virgibacillus dakarensis]MTW85292.1 thiamine diphosphokinase [Virgibacillus dakarensis]GGB29756.1 thiamine pyrophosphokinase [Lentibacillus populi]